MTHGKPVRPPLDRVRALLLVFMACLAISGATAILEHHGLNRCPDRGWHGFQRYTGFGVLAYNLHKIGRRLLERRAGAEPVKVLKRCQ